MRRVATIIFMAVLFIGLVGFIAYKSYLRVEADIEGRFNTSQLVLARHIGHGIAQAAHDIKAEMMTTALLPSIQKGDDRCRARMEKVYNNLKGRIAFLYRLDREGEGTHCFPENAVEQIKDKDSGCNVCITAPIPANGRPAGVIGACVELSQLIHKQIEPGMMQTGKSGYVWIIDDQGRFIVHPEDEFVGRDAFIVRKEMAPEISFEAVNRIMREKMMKGKSGADVYVSGWHREQRGKIKKLIAYAPFRIKERQYSVALVTPASEVASLTRENFRNTLTTMAVITVLMFSGLLFVLHIDRRRIEALEREAGLAEAKKADLLYFKEYNEKIVASIPASLLVLDRNLNIKSVNRTYRETGGIKDEDVVGKNIKEVFPHQILKEGGLLQAFEAVLATKERRSLYEVKHTSSDHPEKILNITVSGLRRAEEEEEEDATLILVIEDITERARLHEEIRKSRDFMDVIFKTSVDIVVATDERGIITFGNRAVEKIMEYKEEELVGRHVSELYDRGRERAKDIMGILTAGRPLEDYRMTLLAKRGREIPVSISGSLLKDSRGRVIGTLGFLRDVSKLVKAEEDLREKNKELENFVYIVSHDLKSPIVSMQGFSSILLNEYREKLGAEGERYLDRIRANASRMEVLISDLLALSRVGRVVGAFKDVSSLDIVNRVCNGLKSRLEETGTEVSISDDLPIIHCDADRIYQVFENLIANAVKFTGDAEKPKIEIRHEDKGKFHQFCVKDNGIGIDPEYHQKIFEIFQRLNEIEDAEGTGIGLVIVERIVNNHGGKVWVESEGGKGATFYFTVPLAGDRGTKMNIERPTSNIEC